MKPEGRGSLLVKEKYREEKACDRRHPYRLITIIIIIRCRKIVSYKDLETEMQLCGMHGQKYTSNTVAPATISKPLTKYLSKITVR